ncbi:MAG TPA: hypothetical protein VLE95_08265, partial [Chlamydiales bacterium]|nr:hypothetical protein [Chlamydiales bacterium]
MLNPLIGIWMSPRATIRSIVNLNPKYGVFYLAWIYALQNYFYFSNYWSFGLRYSFYTILAFGLVLAPLYGLIWVYFSGYVLHLVGRILGGKAPSSHLRAAAAWSSIPSIISLFMWLALMISASNTVFVSGTGSASVFVNLIFFILRIWSFI